MPDIDCLVVGAGVVGLAVARALAMDGREVIVAEAASSIGTGISSRSSEVIHAGLYYPAGSRKALFCSRGRDALYDYCAAADVPHRRVGKIVVASSDDAVADLCTLHQTAARNGVPGLRWLDGDEVNELEPQVRAVAGLLSPETGIVDSAALMSAFSRDLTSRGGEIVLQSAVVGGRTASDHPEVEIEGSGVLSARWVINAAGLSAWQVAQQLIGFPGEHIPECRLAKGNYFQLSQGRAPASHLIYPLPTDGGLGVHLTLDLDGRARFGPDVEWVDAEDYAVDPRRAAEFRDAVAQYWPAVADHELVPAYAGVRPKIGGPGSGPADFVLSGPAEHGVPGVVNLFGIESPGLTSSLAIGAEISSIVEDGGS